MSKKDRGKNLNIVLSTGGTGGHIFPAIACAKTLNCMGCTVSIYTNKKEKEWQYPLENISLVYIESGSILTSRAMQRYFSILYTIKGFFQARKHLKQAKAEVVVGFGSYTTVPTLLAAMSLRLPIVLHEQNAFAGRANRLFGRFAVKIATAFKNPIGLRHDICVHTGNPVRKDIEKVRKNYQIPKSKIYTILITGGSQGAEIFGKIIPKALLKYKQRIRIIQQSKKTQIATLKSFYKKHKIPATVTWFIKDMASALQQADFTISRSGAGSITENACVGIASILIPYKHAINNHQLYNAKALEKAGGAFIIEQDNFSCKTLQKCIDSLINSSEGESIEQQTLKKMAKNAAAFFVKDADKKVADVIYAVATKRKKA